MASTKGKAGAVPLQGKTLAKIKDDLRAGMQLPRFVIMVLVNGEPHTMGMYDDLDEAASYAASGDLQMYWKDSYKAAIGRGEKAPYIECLIAMVEDEGGKPTALQQVGSPRSAWSVGVRPQWAGAAKTEPAKKPATPKAPVTTTKSKPKSAKAQTAKKPAAKAAKAQASKKTSKPKPKPKAKK